jgi:hypothetical protein
MVEVGYTGTRHSTEGVWRKEMNVWRLKTNTGEHLTNQTEFCVSEGVAGFGWSVEQVPGTVEEYKRLAKVLYVDGAPAKGWKPDWGWQSAINALADRAQHGDLVWARTADPMYEYWIGRIHDVWRYEASPRFQTADVVNIRPCTWHRIGGPECTPTSVRNSFSGRGRTLQLVGEDTTRWVSALLWNRAGGEPRIELELPTEPELFELVGQEELEDVISVFLQKRFGYLVWPSTKVRNLPGIESVFVARDGSHTAVLQVKGGKMALDPRQFAPLASAATQVFLFAASGCYGDVPPPANVLCIPPGDIREFVVNHAELLPPIVRAWVEELRVAGTL